MDDDTLFFTLLNLVRGGQYRISRLEAGYMDFTSSQAQGTAGTIKGDTTTPQHNNRTVYVNLFPEAYLLYP